LVDGLGFLRRLRTYDAQRDTSSPSSRRDISWTTRCHPSLELGAELKFAAWLEDPSASRAPLLKVTH
jgi:hypothetical protein